MKNTFSLKKAFSFGWHTIWNNISSMVATWLSMIPFGLPAMIANIAYPLYYGIDKDQLAVQSIRENPTLSHVISVYGWFSIGLLLSTILMMVYLPGLYKITLDAYDTGRWSYKTLFSQWSNNPFPIWMYHIVAPSLFGVLIHKLTGLSAVSIEYKGLIIACMTLWFWLYGAVPFLLVENKISLADILLNRQWKKVAIALANYKWILLGFISACASVFFPPFYFVVLFAQAYAYRQLFTDNTSF